MSEWESNPFLDSCFSLWQKYVPLNVDSLHSSLIVLSFNVRGLELRWQEVFLLTSSFSCDILILLETGNVELSFYEKIFNNFRMFYQKGENKNGGILILVKFGIQTIRLECKLPNVCVVNIKGEETLRIVGVYAPESKSWSWEDLSPFLSKKCVIYGDFNVDIELDGKKAEMFLEWADTNFLAPFTPESPTSLRSDRVLDYALAAGLSINIQNYRGHTTSDHTPIISIIQTKIKNEIMGKNVHWKVFSLFTEYTFSFWEERWNLDHIDDAYNDYNRFLYLLSARCIIMFPLEKYRPSIPVELRSFLSYIRALSFRQMRTKNIELKKILNSLRRVAKKELKSFFASQFSSLLNLRNTSTHAASFWSKCRKHLRTSSSTIDAFIAPSGHLIKDPKEMCETAADFYEVSF